MPWQIGKARRQLGQLVHRALDEGPQVVTRHGEAVVVVVSAEEYRRLTGGQPDFRDFLLSAPDLSALELERAADLPREVEL